MRSRAEAFGAWVRIDDATLVAVSRRAAKKLGVEGGDLWRSEAPTPARAPATAPLEAHVAVTSRCPAGCGGCYLDARPDGEAPPFEELADRLAAIAKAGVFTVAFGGGEPLTRADLGELAVRARELGLTPVVTTSGIGLTRERARTLGAFAQVNVSYDGEGAVYEGVRGYDGAPVAERAMTNLREASVPFGVNAVLTRESFGSLAATLARAEALGAREAQLLRYKPAGRGASLEYLTRRLAPAQVDRLLPELERIAAALSMPLRVDCALVPLLAAQHVEAATLARFGVFGCEAGRHLSAVTVSGAVSPCSFAPPSSARATDLEASFATDPHLDAWRTPPEAEPCRSCALREVCRGGCRVVATHLEGSAALPDPECPRVRAHREHVGAT